jgi:hypothetical protein
MLDGGPGFEIDIDAVNQNVGEAEVVSLYFPRLRKTLLLDTRTAEGVGPLIAVVDMVDNASQRFLSLRELRPQLPRPQSITLIPWVLRVDSLRQTGVWERLVERLSACGDESCLEAAEQCIDELQALERLEVVRALTGEQYRTLWGRLGVGDAEEEAD